MSTKFKLPTHDIEFLRKAIRNASIKWTGRSECLRLASKKVFIRTSKSGKPIYKLHWLCNVCDQWHRNISMMEVDHIIEIGPFKGDWNEYLWRHFPGQDGLQALCISCHLKKTKAWNAANTKWKRKTK